MGGEKTSDLLCCRQAFGLHIWDGIDRALIRLLRLLKLSKSGFWHCQHPLIHVCRPVAFVPVMVVEGRKTSRVKESVAALLHLVHSCEATILRKRMRGHLVSQAFSTVAARRKPYEHRTPHTLVQTPR